MKILLMLPFLHNINANLKDFVLNVKDPEVSLRQGIESAKTCCGDNTLNNFDIGRKILHPRFKEDSTDIR